MGPKPFRVIAGSPVRASLRKAHPQPPQTPHRHPSKSLVVGPLAEGQQTASKACLNGTGQCVSFVAFEPNPKCLDTTLHYPAHPHGGCAQAPLLASQTATAVSVLDGSVTFLPASISALAINLTGLAVTGNTSTISIAVEQHP